MLITAPIDQLIWSVLQFVMNQCIFFKYKLYLLYIYLLFFYPQQVLHEKGDILNSDKRSRRRGLSISSLGSSGSEQGIFSNTIIPAFKHGLFRQHTIQSMVWLTSVWWWGQWMRWHALVHFAQIQNFPISTGDNTKVINDEVIGNNYYYWFIRVKLPLRRDNKADVSRVSPSSSLSD